MDETMALMIMDLLLQKAKKIRLFRKDLVFRTLQSQESFRT
jgi:hypothetical protein